MISARDDSPAIPPAETTTADYQTKENSVSFGALVAIVVSGTIIVCVGLAFVGLWLSSRRAGRKARVARGETVSIDGDYSPACERSMSRKLRKVGSSASMMEDHPAIRQWRSLPLLPRVFTGHFVRTSSPNWPSELVHTGRRNPSWIDEDALHGPEMRMNSRFSWGGKTRDSWPMGNVAPTLPKLNQSHPYGRRPEDDTLFGIGHVRTAYGQLRMYSRVLPEPPKPGMVPGLEGQQSRRASSVKAGYGLSDHLRQSHGQSSNPPSPTRSLPETPSKRGRQPSTDSTLSEILRSTEKRLQEGQSAAKSMLMTSPDKMGTSRESLLDHGDVTAEARPLSRSLTQPRTLSPKKAVPSRAATIGHGRKTSESSIMSESDSLLDELLFQIPDCPAGLTSPSRKQRKQEPEMQLLPLKSARSSLSSALSTVYSEDERSEGVKTTINTPSSFAAANIQSIMVSPESMADPFSPEPSLPVIRPLTTHGRPPRQQKAQGLFRESLERSQRLRRMTLGRGVSLPPEIKLPPCPAQTERKSVVFSQVSSVGFVDSLVTAFDNQSSTSKISVKANQGLQRLQPTGQSRLSSVVLQPQTSSFTLFGPRELPNPPTFSTSTKCAPAESSTRDLTSTVSTIRAPSPLRLSNPNLSPYPLPLRHSLSISSSVYSQDLPEPLADTARNPASASLFNDNNRHNNSASFRANSRLSIISNITNNNASTSSATRTPSPGKGRSIVSNPSTPLALTVAELRRMNSCISSASSDNGGNNGAGQGNAAFTPGHRLNGSRNYLSLGAVSMGSSPASSPSSLARVGRELGGGNGSGSPGAGRARRRETLVSVGGSPKRRVGHARVASRKASICGSIKASGSGGVGTGTRTMSDRVGADSLCGMPPGPEGGKCVIVDMDMEMDSEEKENKYRGSSSRGHEPQAQTQMPRVQFTFAVSASKSSAPMPTPAAAQTGIRGQAANNLEDDLILRARPPSGGNVTTTPQSYPCAKRRRYEMGKGSQESLGLYDQDGFLICTPMRGLSPARAS